MSRCKIVTVAGQADDISPISTHPMNLWGIVNPRRYNPNEPTDNSKGGDPRICDFQVDQRLIPGNFECIVTDLQVAFIIASAKIKKDLRAGTGIPV